MGIKALAVTFVVVTKSVKMVKTEAQFARSRVAKYPNQGLEVTRQGKLFCTVCNEGLDAEKASTVTYHVKSNKHKQNLGKQLYKFI